MLCITLTFDTRQKNGKEALVLSKNSLNTHNDSSNASYRSSFGLAPLGSPFQNKSFYLGVGFLAVPLIVYLVMSGMAAGHPVIFTVGFMATALFFIFISIKDKRNIRGVATISFLLITALACSLMSYTLGQKNAEDIYSFYKDEKCHFSGYVSRTDAPTSRPMFVEVNNINNRDLDIPLTVQIFNYSGYYLDCGDYIEFDGKLRQFNENDFLGGEWLQSKGSYLGVKSVKNIRLISDKSRKSLTSAIKGYVCDRLSLVLSGIPNKDDYISGVSISSAMLFGDKSRLDKELKNNFTRSGIIHILCVSGLHFSVILSGLSLVLKYIVKNRRAKFIILVVMAVLYLALCGFARSALRAAIMALVGAACVSGAKRSSCTHVLLIAVCVICIFDPKCIFDSGFRMSVICCIGILCSMEVLEIISGKLIGRPLLFGIISLFIISLSASCFLLPYSLCAYEGVSTVSVVASCLTVIPAQIFLILCIIAFILSFLGLGFINSILSSIISLLCRIITSVAEYFSALEFSYVEINCPDISFLIFALMLGISATVISSKRRAVRFYAGVVSISLIINTILIIIAVAK